jgi:hypothetical protein
VIAGYNEYGLKINDPNSKINSAKRWDIKSIRPQIRSAWEFSLADAKENDSSVKKQ